MVVLQHTEIFSLAKICFSTVKHYISPLSFESVRKKIFLTNQHSHVQVEFEVTASHFYGSGRTETNDYSDKFYLSSKLPLAIYVVVAVLRPTIEHVCFSSMMDGNVCV